MTHNSREGKPDFHMMALAKSECAKGAGELTVVRLGYVTQLLEELYATLHQELQKARHDWLREEIVRLEVMDAHEPNRGIYRSEALQTIIDRYQAELDQDKKQ